MRIKITTRETNLTLLDCDVLVLAGMLAMRVGGVHAALLRPGTELFIQAESARGDVVVDAVTVPECEE